MIHGLTIRWSLLGADPVVEQQLRDYVATRSFARFTGLPGLYEKLWSLAPGAFFSGTYLWAQAAEREAFLAAFTTTASPVSEILGREPESIESYDVIAVAEGAAGLEPLTGAGSALR